MSGPLMIKCNLLRCLLYASHLPHLLSHTIALLYGLLGGGGSGDFGKSILKGTNMQGGAACVPADGNELQSMAQDASSCVLITLIPGKVYTMPAETIITSRKVIMGNPIALPIVDGAATKRLFHVVAGGSLDLHFVMVFRGVGEIIYGFPVLKGGTAMIDLGGRASFLGVIFTTSPKTALGNTVVSGDIRAQRVFGGKSIQWQHCLRPRRWRITDPLLSLLFCFLSS